MNVVAPPKAGKSWLTLALAIGVSTGGSWLGKATAKGRVLLIDGELHDETLTNRIGQVATQMGLEPDHLTDFDYCSLRGSSDPSLDVAKLDEYMGPMAAGEYRLIVLDPLYRLLPDVGEENSNSSMTRVYKQIDAMASRLRTAIAVVHHSSKGDQSYKSVSDIGAGAGAQSRAADTHLVLRPHAEKGAMSVDAITRSFPPTEAIVVRRNGFLFEVASELDPKNFKRSSRNSRRASPPKREWTTREFATEVVGDTGLTKDEVKQRAKKLGMRLNVAERLLGEAEANGYVRRHAPDAVTKHRFYAEPESSPTPEVAQAA